MARKKSIADINAQYKRLSAANQYEARELSRMYQRGEISHRDFDKRDLELYNRGLTIDASATRYIHNIRNSQGWRYEDVTQPRYDQRYDASKMEKKFSQRTYMGLNAG